MSRKRYEYEKRIITDIRREERKSEGETPEHTLMAILFILALTGAKAMVFVYVSNDDGANNDSIIESNTQELASTIDLYNLKHPEKADSKIIVNTDLIGGRQESSPCPGSDSHCQWRPNGQCEY